MANVILTPHVAGYSPRIAERHLAVLLDERPALRARRAADERRRQAALVLTREGAHRQVPEGVVERLAVETLIEPSRCPRAGPLHGFSGQAT